jgi:hypothetical protein
MADPGMQKCSNSDRPTGPIEGATKAPHGDAVVSGVAKGLGSGWQISARMTGDFVIEITWSAPRPVLEIKIGLGWSVSEEYIEDAATDRGQSYLTKSKSYKNGPQQSGEMVFPASAITRFLDDSPVIFGVWDLDFKPAQPLIWTDPFRINGEGNRAIIVLVEDSPGKVKTCAANGMDEIHSGFGSHNLPKRGRKIGADKMNRSGYRRLIKALHDDNDESLKILRLKAFLDADANSMVIDGVIKALADCRTVEALYIQNFEHGMLDDQLAHLGQTLKNGNIWALNVGENFKISANAWKRFEVDLRQTHVTHMYVSEPNFGGIPHEMKKKMRATIRENRKKDKRHCSWDHINVIGQIGQMWWNPRNHIIATPIDRALHETPTRFRCQACRSTIGKDHMITCTGKGCQIVYHMECAEPPLEEERTNWQCPKCVGGAMMTKRNNIADTSGFDIVGLIVKIAEEDDEDSPFKTGHILQREAGKAEDDIPDAYLVEFDDGSQNWCLLEQLRSMVEGELVWVRVEGQPWMPGRIFKHTALCPPEHHRRKCGEEFVELFVAPSEERKPCIWVKKDSAFMRPFDARFTTQLENNYGVGTLVKGDVLDIRFPEDNKWYRATVLRFDKKKVRVLYDECPAWEACEETLDLEEINVERVRRPVSWQGSALGLEDSLRSVKIAQDKLQALRAQNREFVTRDPSVEPRRHNAPQPYALLSPSPVKKKLRGRAAVKRTTLDREAVGAPLESNEKRWTDLSDEEQCAAIVLGYNSMKWDSNEVPPNCCNSRWENDAESVRCWDELDSDQQLAADILGYTQAAWDEGMRGDELPPDNGAVSMFSSFAHVYAMDPKAEAYKAQVLKVRRSKKSTRRWEYLVHYQGWKSRWDEWMDSQRVFKRTKENMQMLGIKDKALLDEQPIVTACAEESRLVPNVRISGKPMGKPVVKKESKEPEEESYKEPITERKAREMREIRDELDARKQATQNSREARAAARQLKEQGTSRMSQAEMAAAAEEARRKVEEDAKQKAEEEARRNDDARLKREHEERQKALQKKRKLKGQSARDHSHPRKVSQPAKWVDTTAPSELESIGVYPLSPAEKQKISQEERTQEPEAAPVVGLHSTLLAALQLAADFGNDDQPVDHDPAEERCGFYCIWCVDYLSKTMTIKPLVAALS